jgi:hypothetical protein
MVGGGLSGFVLLLLPQREDLRFPEQAMKGARSWTSVYSLSLGDIKQLET